MSFKKLLAAVLAVSMTAGFAGCKKTGNSKETNEIEALLDSYVNSLRDLDADKMLSLTNWDTADGEYRKTKMMFDYEEFGSLVGPAAWYSMDTIASSIIINYNSDDIKFDGDTAEMNVEYEMIDWQKAYYDDDAKTFSDFCDLLRDMEKTTEIKGKITFVNEDDEWMITNITKLNEVLGFVDVIRNTPDEKLHPSDTEPTGETTAETTSEETTAGTDFSDSYDRAIAAYVELLDYFQSELDAFYMDFDTKPCGLYDIDGNGIPELYIFIEEEGEEFKEGKFMLYTYNEYAGEAVPLLSYPRLTFTGAQSGGDYIVYVTSDRVIFVMNDGEEALSYVTTDVFDMDMNSEGSFKRNVYYEYDPVNDEEKYTYEYFKGTETISEEDYNDAMSSYVRDAKMILASDYHFASDEPEYMLISVPGVTTLTYQEMVKYLISLV